MLKIRNEQIKALEDVAKQNFEKDLVRHIKEFAPKHSEVIQEEGVQNVVRLGMERAEKYGFTRRGPVQFYVELMFMFGSDFDTDFQMPWASGVLNNDQIKDEMERADFLHEKMLEYLKQIAGENNEYSMKAMKKLQTANMEEYRVAGGNIEKQAVVALQSIHPQKVEYLGEELIKTLLQRGQDTAKGFSITSEQGNALCVALMFSLGHGFADDLLFPWVKATLEDEKISDPNERAVRLEQKMRLYLARVIKYLEERNK